MNFHAIDTDTMRTMTIYDEFELSNAVYDSINYYREKAERLEKENKMLREDGKKMADKVLISENTRLKERLALSYGTFASEKEKKAYEKFEERHMHDRLTSRFNGGKCPYLIPTETGIGTILRVACPICGESEDITDVGAW